MPILDRAEYIEQAYLFRILADRMEQQLATQELLASVRHELLASTNLPLAIDFLSAELRLTGFFAPAMRKLAHYFTPFQTFCVAEAERERGKFDLNQALVILAREAGYRAENPSRQGLFLFQLECLCRNRLNYDRGLTAVADDPFYDAAWRDWLIFVRRQVGFIDLADLIYERSEFARQERLRRGVEQTEDDIPAPLFGEKEGRIAAANRRRDPLLLFAALHRHLGYPAVPVPNFHDRAPDLLPALVRRIERLESRIKMLDEEQ
ncbi:MAG: hypothetical protein SFX18_10330 [Pirellulales bacterium]|nr:hypothetical protein [Pirellulales bacterium]